MGWTEAMFDSIMIVYSCSFEKIDARLVECSFSATFLRSYVTT